MDDVRGLRTTIEASLDDQLALTELRVAIVELSRSGMALHAEQYLPKGTKYRVTMKRAPFLSLRGEVQAVQKLEGGGYEVALDFVDLDEETTARLIAFLESERRRLPANG